MADLLRSSFLLHCILQQFDKTLYGKFLIFNLAAGLLRYNPQDTVFSDAVLQAAHNESFLSRREGRGVHHIEPQGNPRSHF
jgi:hypothetical protein